MAIAQDNKKKKISLKPQGVFEALKDIGSSSTPADEYLAPSAQTALDQLLTKNPLPPSSQNKDQFISAQSAESDLKAKERLFFENKRREERLIYSHQEQEVAREISAIEDELKKIAQQIEAMGTDTRELSKTFAQPTIAPGIYHLNFFEKIRELLILARKKIQESRTWLQVYSQRRQKRNFYWAMVGKKGTSFLLSPERYMSTQAG